MVRIMTLGMAVMLAGTAVAAQQADDSQVRARQRIAMMEERSRAPSRLAPKICSVRCGPLCPIRRCSLGLRVRFPSRWLRHLLRRRRADAPAPVTWPLRALITSDNRDLERGCGVEAVDRADGREISTAALRRPFAGSRCGRRRRTRSPCARPAAARWRPVRLPSRLRRTSMHECSTTRPRSTREVKSALIDAMIENSGPLALGTDEWLTVAARDNVLAIRWSRRHGRLQHDHLPREGK